MADPKNVFAILVAKRAMIELPNPVEKVAIIMVNINNFLCAGSSTVDSFSVEIYSPKSANVLTEHLRFTHSSTYIIKSAKVM